MRKHKAKYGTLAKLLATEHVLHINDTHPTLVIPELMRILMDELRYVLGKCVEHHQPVGRLYQPYGHARGAGVLAGIARAGADAAHHADHPRDQRALLSGPVELLPERFPEDLQARHRVGRDRPHGAFGHRRVCSINGVSALHSDILKERVFKDFYTIYPAKFRNVTNGIAHRRWLCEANPKLAALIESKIGKGYRKHPSELQVLANYGEDKALLAQLGQIKRDNKLRLAEYIKEHNGIEVNMDSIFDVQVKRLHEYKRQHAQHSAYYLAVPQAAG